MTRIVSFTCNVLLNLKQRETSFISLGEYLITGESLLPRNTSHSPGDAVLNILWTFRSNRGVTLRRKVVMQFCEMNPKTNNKNRGTGMMIKDRDNERETLKETDNKMEKDEENWQF